MTKVRSPRASERQQLLKWIAVMKEALSEIQRAWTIESVIRDVHPIGGMKERVRQLDEYPEMSAKQWRLTAGRARELRDALDRVATHCDKQADLLSDRSCTLQVASDDVRRDVAYAIRKALNFNEWVAYLRAHRPIDTPMEMR